MLILPFRNANLRRVAQSEVEAIKKDKYFHYLPKKEQFLKEGSEARPNDFWERI